MQKLFLENMDDRDRYPIGQQNFREIRKDDAYYVDKTAFINKIIRSRSKYYFLARPRRFGKSLFLSALEYFFKGERELFKGLYIDSVDWEWSAYPVLRLDLNTNRYAEQGILDSVLDNIFNQWEKAYDVNEKAGDPSSRFGNIIAAAHEKNGRQVVILVDEYDKPLVGNLHKNDNFEHYRTKLASLYSNFKSCAEHIRLVFLTGVSRFSKLSIFSDINNIDDLSFDEQYADICGITQRELLDNFQIGIEELALKFGITYEQACHELKERYDGYRFAVTGSEIFNPWSLLSCLRKRLIENYWNETGYPTIIAEALKRNDTDLKEILHTHCSLKELKGMDLRQLTPLALMYQTGYITIKDYDAETQLYTLGLPNKEVREGFFDAILPYYMSMEENRVGPLVSKIINSVREGKPEVLMLSLQSFFSKIGYPLKMENENNFQNALYSLAVLIGLNAHAEFTTSQGRIDILIKAKRYIYIIELKYDGSAEEALRQIDQTHYDRPWQTDGRTIFKIGANFSSETRTIESWLIKPSSPTSPPTPLP